MVAGGRSEGIRGRKKGGTIVTWYQETRKTKVGRGKSEVYIFNQRVMKERDRDREKLIMQQLGTQLLHKRTEPRT